MGVAGSASATAAPSEPTIRSTDPLSGAALVTWTVDDAGGPALTRLDVALNDTATVYRSFDAPANPLLVMGLTNESSYTVFLRVHYEGDLVSDWSSGVTATPTISPCANRPALVAGEFVSCWDTSLASPGSTDIKKVSLPLVEGAEYAYNFTVDWGDGTQGTVTAWNDPDATHEYAHSGRKWIRISGTFKGFSFAARDPSLPNDRLKLIDVAQWGALSLGNSGRQFNGAEHVNFSATDAPDLSSTTDLYGAFGDAVSFNSPIEHWNMSNVISVRTMFWQATSFNQPLSGWDSEVSNVRDFGSMFYGARSFNGTVSGWNVSEAVDMSAMFAGASSFDQPLATWNTSKVTNMSDMFAGASSFDQPLATWNTANVTTMASMFNGASSFDQPLMTWNTAKVTNMGAMFAGAGQFDQPLASWNTSDVDNMAFMFLDAARFDQDISAWNTSKVTDLTWTFFRATRFNNGGRSLTWDVRSVTSFSNTFEGTRAFNADISSWNITRPEGVTVNMHAMFHDAGAFNQDLSSWDMSAVVNTSSMFRSTPLFNNGGVPLAWGNKLAKVTNMNAMFYGAQVFNQPIDSWNTSSVTNMSEMFSYSSAFNQVIGGWDVSSVTTMAGMFLGSVAFDQPIGTWDTSSVTDMTSMFEYSFVFNRDISAWDVSSVTTMRRMFYWARLFDQPMGTWDTSSVANMKEMFADSLKFDQDLSDWDVTSATTMTDMFAGVTLSSTHYSAMLEAWSQQAVQSGVTFSGGNSMYYSTAAPARAVLTSAPRNWMISDGGEDPAPDPRPGPTPPPAPVPSSASAPVEVSVVGQRRGAIVKWSPPSAPGSYPVSMYQVLASPSDRSCSTSTLSCTLTSLPVGVAQTVRVRAFTEAGWGAWSDAVAVTSIQLSGEREGRRVTIAGSTSGLSMGAVVTLWVNAGRGFREKRRPALVSPDGSFAWVKRLSRDVPVRVYASVGENISATIRLR